MARARRRWIREQGCFDLARLVFIDETAVSTNLSRLRGWAPRGGRVIATVPLGAWEKITFVAALRHNRMTAPMVVEGARLRPRNSQIFGALFPSDVEGCRAHTSEQDLRRKSLASLAAPAQTSFASRYEVLPARSTVMLLAGRTRIENPGERWRQRVCARARSAEDKCLHRTRLRRPIARLKTYRARYLKRINHLRNLKKKLG